jgi:hypothetical protein
MESAMDANFKAAEEWSERVADSILMELQMAKLIVGEKDSKWAHRIIAQDLFIQWTGGMETPAKPPHLKDHPQT